MGGTVVRGFEDLGVLFNLKIECLYCQCYLICSGTYLSSIAIQFTTHYIYIHVDRFILVSHLLPLTV
ncbi:hypothetical protein EYC80_006013 [Monilinia laxa]|uniref:Uncharacterized protein n=1 Tax=Monilinia laxa TaxID=61186 RepID=A0A5N6KG70_MONLA|nr:hypothetical protein EYC80_006013 [Monilinia laxa]